MAPVAERAGASIFRFQPRTQKHRTLPMSENSDEQKQPEAAPEFWIPLKQAAAEAGKHEVTLKRSIAKGVLKARKAGPGHNASYEVDRTSLEAWIAKSAPVAPVASPAEQAVTVSAAEGETVPDGAVPAQAVPDASGQGDVPVERRDKRARSKEKAARKKEMSLAARQMRRWKNSMRCASEDQKLSMIRWISARLVRKDKTGDLHTNRGKRSRLAGGRRNGGQRRG